MCIDTVLWAFKQEHLTGAERYVLIALSNHANKSHACWPSLDTIGRFTGQSRRTVRRCLRRLESLGYIKTSTRHEKNQQRSSLYTLHTMQSVGGSQCPGGEVTQTPLGGSQWPTEPVTEPVIEPKVPAQSANERRIDMDQNEVPIDEPPKVRLFREGKTILVSMGLSESRSGSVIGQWLKKNPDALGILAALTYARDNGVIEPIGYVTRLLNISKGETNGKRYDQLPAAERAHQLANQARELEYQAGFGRQDDPVRRH